MKSKPSKRNRRARRSARLKAVKKSFRGAAKRNTLVAIEKAVNHLLAWSRQADTHVSSISIALHNDERAKTETGAGLFVSELQKNRRFLEELYCWARESGGPPAQEYDPRRRLEEGVAIIDALFEELKTAFGIEVVKEVDEIIDSPKPRDRRFSYAGKYDPLLAKAKVLFPGLRIGARVISPAEVEQVPP